MASNTISMIGQLRQAGEEVRSSAINSALLDLFERFNKVRIHFVSWQIVFSFEKKLGPIFIYFWEKTIPYFN